jgi:hypothetical protein
MVSVLTGVLFGLAPAWRSTGRHNAVGLQLGSRVIGHERWWGLRSGLVIAQVALSLVLLAAGGLFITTLRNLKTMDLGFHADNLLLVPINPRAMDTVGPTSQSWRAVC